MNHTIIKKALNDALTRKYYDELMKTEDEEHIFGVGFTADMKRLIRKTDDKLLYYSKYAAIAACACIAIGCAVLLPNLINSGIRTEPPVTTTPVVESDPESGTTTPEDTSLPIIITTAPDETTLDTDSAVTTEITTTEITTTPVTTTEEKVTETEKEEDEVIDDAEGDPIIDGDIVDGDTDSDTATPDSDGDVIIDTEEGDDVVIEGDEDDTTVDIENDVETEEDDEVEIEDDCDVEEDDVVEDSDDSSGDYEIKPLPSSVETLNHGIAFFLWDNHLEDISGRIHAISGYGVVEYPDGATGIDYYFGEGRTDLSFITDYLESQKDAPRITENYPDTDADNDYLVIEISDTDAFTSEIYNFHDYSARNEYGYYFGNEAGEDSMDDEEIYERNSIRVCIRKAGYVHIESYRHETVFFDVDDAATAELFKFVESRKPSSVKTTSDFLKLGVTADNIYSAYGDIRGIYDINIQNVNFDTAVERAELVSFLSKFDGRSLKKHEGSFQYTRGTLVTIGLKDRPTEMDIVAKDGRLYFYIDGMGYYYTDITERELCEFISLICKTGGVAEPYYYTTAYDYLTNVGGVTSFRDVSHRDYKDNAIIRYIINDENKLADFYSFIVGELENAEYDPYAPSGTSFVINVKINDNTYFYISEDDTISIIGNKFYTSEGFYNRVIEYLKKNAEINIEDVEPAEPDIEETDDVMIEEDIAIEDEIDE